MFKELLLVVTLKQIVGCHWLLYVADELQCSSQHGLVIVSVISRMFFCVYVFLVVLPLCIGFRFFLKDSITGFTVLSVSVIG